MSTVTPRVALRAACAIHQQLNPRRSKRHSPSSLPRAGFARCERLMELLEHAQAQQWEAAASVCRGRLRRALEDVHRQLRAVMEEHDAPRRRPASDLQEIYDDLAALDQEFDVVRIDLVERKIVVTTAPIKLQGIHLGRFEVILDWKCVGNGGHSYDVVALSPNASQADDSVTHPHVRDYDLCEGEAYAALHAALDSGRLLDFFVIIAQTLGTYNAGSAYVRLEEWTGVSCADCGGAASDDESTSCERCECALCYDCGGRCSACGRTICSECDVICAACRETYCDSCVSYCSACKSHFCERCLIDGQCEPCRKAAQDAQREVQTHSQPSRPCIPATDAPCLGETALSA